MGNNNQIKNLGHLLMIMKLAKQFPSIFWYLYIVGNYYL